MESPDSNRPVFCIMTIRLPAADPETGGYGQTFALSADGHDFDRLGQSAICSYMKLVSLSGSHTT